MVYIIGYDLVVSGGVVDLRIECGCIMKKEFL